MAGEFDYTKARATAEKLIKKFGQAGTVYLNDEPGGEDALGDPLPSTSGKIINGFVTPLLPYSTQTQLSVYEKENVKSGDMYAFFHSDELIDINMLHDSSGDTWRVQSVSKITSVSGTNVYQKMMLRK